MTATELHLPRLGPAGEPCRSCGSLLAEDQRYCLSCGERRAEMRLQFRRLLEADVVQEQVVSPATASRPSAARTATTAVLGIACLLLALGVGILIGDAAGGDGTAAAPPAPQVITVGAPAAASTPPTTTGDADTGTDAGSDATAGKAAGKDAEKSADDKATSKDVKALDDASPEEFQKRSEKLPKTLGTGGKAPPKDDKPAAGGGGFEEIG